MIVTRRGKRTAPSYVGKQLVKSNISLHAPKNGEERFIRILRSLLRPTMELPAVNGGYQKIYQNLTELQQKNLIDKTANQILYAHSSVVSQIFSNLALVSMDFSQKTEVAFRRLLMEKQTKREA